MPSARRLVTLGGAVFVGLAATALFAAPASAHEAGVVGTSDCDASTGTYTVHWTISSVKRDHAFTLTDVKPASAAKTVENKSVKATTDFLFDQTGIAGTDTKAKLTFTAKWDDNFVDSNNPYSGVVKLRGDCGTPCPQAASNDGKGKPPASSTSDLKGDKKPKPVCESASPSPSTGGEGGGKPAPSSSSSTPSLPVTGSQTSAIAGGAVVLLGAGTGLFFLARRRRVKFEA